MGVLSLFAWMGAVHVSSLALNKANANPKQSLNQPFQGGSTLDRPNVALQFSSPRLATKKATSIRVHVEEVAPKEGHALHAGASIEFDGLHEARFYVQITRVKDHP